MPDPEAGRTEGTFMAKLRLVSEHSTGPISFVREVLQLIFGTIAFTISVAFSLIIPIAEVIIGSMFVEKCKVEQKIPIYIIVTGVVSLVRGSITLTKKATVKTDGSSHDPRGYAAVHVIDLFLLVWTVLGAIWVFSNYKPDYEDENADNYCHPVMYIFAFAYLTAIFILMSFLFCCCCCLMCFGFTQANNPNAN